MHTSEWRGNITGFACKLCTLPAFELRDATIPEVVNTVAPADGPALIANKDRVVYIVPTLLQDAPLVGKTLERATARGVSTIGKQRSASHVTSAAFMIFEFDGLHAEQCKIVHEKLYSSGLHYLIYTTWSHGRTDKPGVRARVIIFLDRELEPLEYAQAWAGGNAALFSGLADTTGARVYQQQGVWATAPEREHLAFRIVKKGALASVDALIDAAPKVTSVPASSRPTRISTPYLRVGVSASADRLRAALNWIDPNNYTSWISTLAGLRAAALQIGEEAAHALWIEFSESADATAKAKNETDRYSPESMWARFSPSAAPVDALLGAIFARARDSALAAIGAERGRTEWSERGRKAYTYMAANHPKSIKKIET